MSQTLLKKLMTQYLVSSAAIFDLAGIPHWVQHFLMMTMQMKRCLYSVAFPSVA
jgi:hypothetical protein